MDTAIKTIKEDMQILVSRCSNSQSTITFMEEGLQARTNRLQLFKRTMHAKFRLQTSNQVERTPN